MDLVTILGRWFVLLFVLAAPALSAPVLAWAGEPIVGVRAPAFSLRTLDGRTVTNAAFHGKTLVINVWGSWCPPCRMETPDLVAEAGADAGTVAFLGVNTTETAAVVRAFAAAKGVGYAQAVVTGDSAFARDYAIRNYPTTFVIDPRGVLRARHADNILPRSQLHAYIEAARHGASAPLVSDEQRKLDAVLDARKFPFHGSAKVVIANVRAAAEAIAAAENEMDDAMTDPGRDHDLVATQAREQRLRNAAVAALAPIATSAGDRVLLARLRGDGAAARGDWRAAESAYADALAIDPNDRDALGGAAYAAAERGDAARSAEFDARIAAIAPSYASEVSVARAQARLGHHDASLAALDRAIVLAQANRKPAQLAWTHLYGGRAAVELGDTTRARAEFAAAATAAAAIPHANPRYAMYLEQAQEAGVALSLGTRAKAGLSIAPWTGAELPGSIASTYKYRLAVTAPPAASIDLAARGLPKGWIGSFCSDRLCSPFTTSIVVPPTGVKIVEFQVIPGTPRKTSLDVTIQAGQHGKILAQAATAVVP